MSTITLGPDHDHPTPPGAKRFGLYSVAWAAWTAAFFAIEMPAVIKNAKGSGRLDYQHRTLTENLRWLGATDRDGKLAKHAHLRRMLMISGLAIGVAHFVTDGDYI
jgi:hypothetical protein